MRDLKSDPAKLGETQLATPTDPRAAAPAATPARIGRFRVTGLLGEGGMGVVYAAEDEVLGRKVAVKLLHAHTGNAEARSLAEARALARLAHPNVVAIHEVGTHAGAVYVAMEFIVGVTLRVWLARSRPWRDRLAVLIQAGRGLAAAHAAGLVHRDFKPDNVQVGDDGRVRVLDFGLAIDEQLASGGGDTEDGAPVSGRMTREGALVGTPLYMAPEQWVADPTDPRTDQFALGLVLYEGLYGQRAFAGATVGELRGAVLAGAMREPARGPVPAAVLEAVRRALAIDPDQRHPSIDALLAVVLAAARPRRRRELAAAAALAMVAAAGVAVAAWPDDAAGPRPGPYDAILAASDLPAVQPAPLPDDPMQVTVDRLSNGVTVYISPDRSKPRIHAAVVVRTGSLRDPPGMSGLSHMMGHMLAKGSHRVGTADFAAERPHLDRIRALYAELAAAPGRRDELLAAIDAENVAAGRYVIASESMAAMTALGATAINVSTGRDWTRSVAELPSNRLDTWAELEADRWTNLVFRQYYPEVGAVLEELRGMPENGRQGEALASAVFAGHPYGLSPIGTAADVQAQPYLALESFYATWFVPNNAAVVLVGDVDRAQALPVLERAFGSWQPRALPEAAPPPPTPMAAPTTMRLASSGERFVMMMWPLPPAGHPDSAALELVGRLLTDARTGLLRARAERGELAGIGIEAQQHRAAGQMLIQATPGPGRDPASLPAVVDDVLATVARGEVSQDVIDAVAREATLEEPGRSAAGLRRDRLVDAYAAGQTWSEVAAAPQRLAAVRAADLARVVTRYLGATRAVAIIEPGEVEPRAIERPHISPVQFSGETRSAWVGALLATEAVPIQPRFLWAGRDYTWTDTAAGPVITVPNERDEGFWLRLEFALGNHHVRGLCAALVADQLSDDPAATARRQGLRRLGIELTVDCTATTASIEAVGRDRQLDALWQAIDAWMTAPAPPAAEVAIRLDRYRERLAQVAAEADWRWRALTTYAAFGPASPRLALISAAARPDLTGDDLVAALATLRRSRRATLYYGPRAAAKVAALVGAIDGPATDPAPVLWPTLRPARPRIVVLDHRGPDATEILLRFPMTSLVGDRILLAELLERYLDGDTITDPMTIALRSERGLVYGQGASLALGARPDDHADVLYWIKVAPEHAVTAIELVLPLLRDDVPDPDRVTEARAALEAQYRGDWLAGRGIAYAVTDWIQEGHDGDPRVARFGQIHTLGEAELGPLLAELAAAPMIIAIAGDAARLDLPRLRALGDVTVLTAAAMIPPIAP